MTTWKTKSFTFFTTSDTINLTVSYFVKNSSLCYTEAGIPYALLIGHTNNPSSTDIPRKITVLAKCDNYNYLIGQNLKIVSTPDPTRKPLYVTKDTIINTIKYHWLIGSENPAIWGKIL